MAELEELYRAVREARRLATAVNVTLRPRVQVPLAEGLPGPLLVELLLVLEREGGAVPLTLLAKKLGSSPSQLLPALRELEKRGFVRVIESPTRVGVLLTPEGLRLATELAWALAV